jgi:hypothetical protein
MEERRTSDLKLAVLERDISYIRQTIDETKEKIIEVKILVTDNYVTHQEFLPIRNLVYGFAGLILIAVVGGLVSLVVIK